MSLPRMSLKPIRAAAGTSEIAGTLSGALFAQSGQALGTSGFWAQVLRRWHRRSWRVPFIPREKLS